MKKLIFCLGIVAFLGAGVLLFHLKVNKRKDAIITSKDEKVTLVFERITAEAVEEQSAYFTTIFVPISADTFFEEYIVDRDDYVCSFTDTMEKTEEETGSYLLMKNHHCFFVRLDGESVSVQEMIAAYYPPDRFCAPVFSVPFLMPSLPHSEKKQIPWEDMILADNWEALIDFYESISWKYQLEGDVLYLSVYESCSPRDREIWYDNAVKITEISNGIEIEFIKDGLPISEW